MAVIPLTISGLKEAQADLERLNKEFEKVKDDPIKSKKLAKEFNDLSKAVDDATDELVKMNEAGKLLGVRFDDLNEVLYGTKEEILPLSSQIGEMEDRMYQLAAAGQTNSDEFRALQGETARLRKVIIDTDKSVDLLAENRGLSVFGTGLTQVGERLLALDFEGAAKDATAMNQAVGNLGQMGKSALTGLFKTVGQLGKAFTSIGRALLTNPIFLIAAAVTGLVAIIGLLMNKLGILKPILNTIGEVFGAIGEAIDWVVQNIKDFLDWLGLTNFAAEEFATKQQEGMQKVIDRSNELTESITDRYDQEIRLAKIAGEDTTQAEIEKQQAIIKTSEIRLKAIDAIIKQNEVSNKLSEEEIQKLRELRKETEKTIRESNQEIEAINAQAEADNKSRLEKERQDNKAAYDKMLADRKKYEQDRLNAIRQIRDLELELMEEGINKDLAVNQEKYSRLIADTLKNETLNAEEKQKITDLLRQQEFEKTKEIELGYAQQLSDALKEAEQKRKEEAEAQAEKDRENREAFNAILVEAAAKANEEELENYQKYVEAREGLQDSLVGSLSGLASSLEAAGVRTAGLQKVLALVDIATNTAKSISAVIAGASAAAAATGPAAPYVLVGYIASGIATVISSIASAYAALKSAPSIGGSVGGGGTAIASASGGVQAAQPSVNLFGQNNNLNNLSSAPDVEANQEITVKAFVSETEVTATQNKIKKLQQSAVL